MFFIAILVLTTLALAGSAAFFSIYGLAQIFTGSFWPVVIMASSLETGKLVAASYVYRYWKEIGFLMKSYLISAILILMVITSAGIFGFLSSAYQQDILPLELMEQQIVLLDEEKSELEILKTERLERRKQIDADIASLPNNYITGRQRLMESYGPELEQIRADIKQYTDDIREKTLKIQELKSTTLETEAEVGPIIFIAESFGREVDDATKWLILMIIFAFDPLAVVLTIGANIAIVARSGRKKIKVQPVSVTEAPVVEEPEPTVTSVEQLMSDPTSAISVDQIQNALDEFAAREKQLTPAEIAQRGMLEEMLRKKQVKERVRQEATNLQEKEEPVEMPLAPSVLDTKS